MLVSRTSGGVMILIHRKGRYQMKRLGIMLVAIFLVTLVFSAIGCGGGGEATATPPPHSHTVTQRHSYTEGDTNACDLSYADRNYPGIARQTRRIVTRRAPGLATSSSVQTGSIWHSGSQSQHGR